MDTEEQQEKNAPPAGTSPVRIGPNMYLRGCKIYFRIWVDDKRKWVSTGTDSPSEARKIFNTWKNQQVLRQHGISPTTHAFERQRLTVGKVLDAYVGADYPHRKGKKKADTTKQTEAKAIVRLKAYFSVLPAGSLTAKDCNAYKTWRSTGGYKWTAFGKERRGRANTRLIDLELSVLSNTLDFAVMEGDLKANPLKIRPHYHSEEDTRHCREFAPTPEELLRIEKHLRDHGYDVVADVIMFLAFCGLRINEALRLRRFHVDAEQGIIHVKRQKKGINPFIHILPEMEALLADMQRRCPHTALLFPAPRNPLKSVNYQFIQRRLLLACRALGIKIRPHGLRSFFVTQARGSGLVDRDIAALIGDKSGATIIERTYGDIRPAHLFKEAKRIQLLGSSDAPDEEEPSKVA